MLISEALTPPTLHICADMSGCRRAQAWPMRRDKKLLFGWYIRSGSSKYCADVQRTAAAKPVLQSIKKRRMNGCISSYSTISHARFPEECSIVCGRAWPADAHKTVSPEARTRHQKHEGSRETQDCTGQEHAGGAYRTAGRISTEYVVAAGSGRQHTLREQSGTCKQLWGDTIE